MSHTEKKLKVVVYYDGRVQGVGFRYSVCHIAGNYNVAGYVKNLRDGRVELCAEGESVHVASFIESVENSHLKKYILASEKNWYEYTGEFKGFGLRY